MDAGVIRKKTNSARKNAAALAPQWCTWGEQVFRHKDSVRLDEAALTTMYDELQASGMQAGMFSIDDKWESAYGSLARFYGTAPPGDGPTPERIAKYNGLTHLLRPSNQFSILPLDADYEAPTRGAHASSWARLENGEVTLVALRKQRIAGGMGSGKFRDFVSTSTSVVVAARSSGSIARAAQLGVVPYGDGELRVKREGAATSAHATEHYFGGGHKPLPVAVENGRLRVPLRERVEDGILVEWIDISIQGG